jgi:guanine deaminase
MNYFMKLAIEKAKKTSAENIGGPFGACIVKDGKVVAIASNNVLSSHDPTGHAEVNAIRMASEALGTHDLSGCIMYATGYPCPMCLGAMIWAKIDTLYYGCTPADAEKIGFRDDFIYRYIRTGEKEEMTFNAKEIDRAECLKHFNEYAKNNKEIY